MSCEPHPLYRLTFNEPWTHLVEVEITIPVPDPARPVELWMPVWTPGSYLVREFSRHVERFSAQDETGAALPWQKTAKNRWTVETEGRERITVRYGVYGRDMSVRTNWIAADWALLNGAPTFLLVRGLERRPHEIRLEIPPSWAGAWTALDPATGALAFTAPDADTLIDSPILAGTPAVYPLQVEGADVTLVNLGEGGLWDGAQAARDVETIVREYARMYGGFPFSRYVFLNVIAEAGGGLEHRNSCVLMASRYTFRRRKAYADWLGLASHEFFHVWNVKRSRPAGLGPFDYERETYTRNLWVAEGITNYYTDLVPCRAGLTTENEYLEFLSELVEGTQKTPGRRLHSLEDASFDAWIKYYRPDENTANTSVNYYQKGAVAAWLLDAEIRRATKGERSLDDLMRVLYRDYSGDQGFTEVDVQKAAEATAGCSLTPFFDRFIRGREEFDYASTLAFLGLKFRDAHDGDGADTPKVWAGWETRTHEGRLLVSSVHREGPARAAGINAEDEILALGGYRVTPATWKDRLLQYGPGERVEVLVSRRDAVLILPLVLAENPGNPWRVIPDPEATAEQLAARRRWLGLATKT